MNKFRFLRWALIPLAGLALIDGGCVKQIRKQRLDSQANDDFAAGRYDQALVEYSRAVLINKNDPVANRQLGIIYATDGIDVQALTYLRKALDLAPGNAEARLKYAALYLAHGGAKEAAVEAQKALAVQPGSEDGLLILVKCARTPAEIEATRKTIEGLRKKDKDRASYHLALGALSLSARDQAGAEREFRQALELDPKSSGADIDLGSLALLVHHDAKEAEADFKAGSALAPLRSIRRLRYAQFMAENGRFDEANAAVTDIVRQAPDYLPAVILATKLAFQQKRYDQAQGYADQILRRDPGNFDGLLESGSLKRIRGDLDGAISDYRHADSIYTHNLQLEYELALTYLLKGDIVVGRNLLNQVLTINPNFEAAILALGEVDLRTGDAAGTISVVGDWLKGQKSASAQAYRLLARAYEARQEFDPALATYASMAKADPKSPEPAVYSAMIYEAQKQPAAARHALEHALALAPNYGPARERLLELDLAEKRYGPAAEWVAAMAKQYPASAAPHVFQSRIELAQHHVEAAEAELKKAIATDPKFQAPYLALADLYIDSNQSAEALAGLTALAKNGNSVTALTEIGLIQLRLKHYEEAAAAYRKVIAADPKSLPALNNLAYLEAENLGKIDDAYALAQRAHALEPDDPDAADTLGWVLYRKKDFRQAVPLLQGSADKVPSSGAIQYHLGMAHYMLGESEAARTAFKAALATTAPFLGREDAVRRLAVLDLEVKTATPAVRSDLEKQVKAEPDDPVVRARLAEIQAQSGDNRAAAANFEAAIKLNPRDPATLLAFSRLNSGPLHDRDRALALAQAAHEITPADPDIALQLGELVYQAGDYARSLSLLQGASDQLAQQPELLYDLARDQYNVGRIADADASIAALGQSAAPFSRRDEEKSFALMVAASKDPAQAAAALPAAQKILAAHPTDVPARMVSALALEQQGNYPQAAQAYAKLLADDPLFSPATRRMALLYAQKLGDDTRAYDLVVKTHETYPDDVEITGTLGILDYRRADYADAAHLFQDALRSRGNDPEMIYYLGMSHYKMSQASDAKAELQRALDLDVSEGEAAEARRALDELKAGGGDYHGPSLLAQPIN